MYDWAKKLFTEPHTLAIIISSGLIGLFAGFWQGIVQKRHGGWGGFAQAVISGIFVAVIVGLAIQGWVESEGMRFAIVGAAAVVSEDILAGLKTIGKSIKDDPFGAVFRILDAMRGRPPQPRTPTGNTVPSALDGGR